MTHVEVAPKKTSDYVEFKTYLFPKTRGKILDEKVGMGIGSF